jgi:hypothetical protein
VVGRWLPARPRQGLVSLRRPWWQPRRRDHLLPDAPQAQALAALARWTGVQPLDASARRSAVPEDWSIDRQRRLPL